MRLELAARQRAAQVAFQVEHAQRFGAQLLVEQFEALASLRLGAIHRHVGIAQQFLGAGVARMRARRCRCWPR
jgi:hypothetical protein